MTNNTFCVFPEQPISEQPQIDISLSTETNLDTLASIKRASELEEEYESTKLPEGFYFHGNHLMFQPEGKPDQEDPPSPIRICQRLEIGAIVRDDNNKNFGRLLEFSDVDGIRKKWAMPMELLSGDGTQYRAVLLSMGLEISPAKGARQILTIYIQSSRPKQRIRCVNRTGWHRGEYFVLPDLTIGPKGKEEVILQTTSPCSIEYETKGSLDDWKEQIGRLCERNNLLLFSVCAAFSPPLLKILNMESGGFHFRGASSTGKTTTLLVAASIWGGPEHMQRWRATSNGLEACASNHNDALLCLDELSQVNPEAAGEIAYMLANGSGKLRSTQSGNAKEKSSWSLVFLSTGEISLATHMVEAGKKARAGQEVRLVDIPAEGLKYGMFEELHGYQNGSSFSNALGEATKKTYGVPSREFLRNLVEKKAEIEPLIKKYIENFMFSYVPEASDGQVFRVARRFGLISAAGELASFFGITGWESGTATAAVKFCFEAWLKNRGTFGPQEERTIIAQVMHFFQTHGTSRFTPWDAHDSHQTIQRAGFRKNDGEGGTEYFLFTEVFKSDLCRGLDPVQVAKTCIKNGFLMPDSKGKPTRSEKLPGMAKSKRVYRFTDNVMGIEE